MILIGIWEVSDPYQKKFDGISGKAGGM